VDLIVEDSRTALWGKTRFRCAVGKNGLIAATQKREGDQCTPAGRWPMREVFYRADRLPQPKTPLPIRALAANDGWCEIPGDAKYNQLVKHPYPVAVDRLWRDDHIYDVIVTLGYNDRPAKAGMGSAIFLHVARPDFGPSAGCVTLQLNDLLLVLREADRDSCVDVKMI
jgi:L,D-peptidoglycan transpeptidase YkuD (ErfK/YbiS/YcfS/YnhG family)